MPTITAPAAAWADARIVAASKRVGDLKALHTRWSLGEDPRPIAEVMAEVEHITYSIRSYLDGVPGLYLQPRALSAEAA